MRNIYRMHKQRTQRCATDKSVTEQRCRMIQRTRNLIHPIAQGIGETERDSRLGRNHLARHRAILKRFAIELAVALPDP